MSTRGLLVAVLLFPLLSGCAARNESPRAAEDAAIDAHVAELRSMVAGAPDRPRARVMLLGVFHFDNPGRDAHKIKYTFDLFSESGQKQLKEVLDRLAEFKPTKILVEYESAKQGKLDELFARYRKGELAGKSNEIYTVGFALAQRLGHERVYGFDADGESPASAPKTWEAFVEIANGLHKEAEVSPPIDKLYEKMNTQADEIQQTLTLRQRLLLLNQPDLLRLSNGAYFSWSGFQVCDGKEFPGPDGFASGWYNRNLRMFSTIQRSASEKDDRVLVVVGAGHVPILQFFTQSCPTMTWVPLKCFLHAR